MLPSTQSRVEGQTLKTTHTFRDRIDRRVFDVIYSRSLVYNACWEDPAVDRKALGLGPNDTMLVITSAGCNVLDYLLDEPRRIHAVDANPRQTALLELKMAGIRRLEHADFFALFGKGHHPRFPEMLHDTLAQDLSPFASAYWARRVGWFANPGRSFYFYSLAGIAARMFRFYLASKPRLGRGIAELFDARSMDEQRRIYDERVHPLIWSRSLNWTLSRQFTMNLLGVPHPQRRQVQAQHTAGIAGFVRDSVEYVFRELPVWTNYFWSVYARGHYRPDCCPGYLRRENFDRLKTLVDRVTPHTATVTDYLRSSDERISRFVLLDHMDWMSSYYPEALAEEWFEIMQRATLGARVLFRSAHASPSYLDAIRVESAGRLLDHLEFDRALAARLQREDRVHTYAGFHIADLRV